MIEWFRRGGLMAALLCAAPGPAAARAAPADTTRLTFAVGPLFDAHTDLLASPFRQTGTGFTLGVGFARGGFSADLGGSTTSTSSSLDRDDEGVEDGWSAGLDVSYLRRVAGGARTTWRVGGALSGLAFVRRHHYGGNASREYFDDLIVPLSGVGEVSRAFGRSTVLEERLGVGLVAILFRSPFAAAKTSPTASLAGPGALRLVRNRLRATWWLSPRTRLLLDHEATFYDTDRHRLVRVVQQRLTAGLGIVFGGAG